MDQLPPPADPDWHLDMVLMLCTLVLGVLGPLAYMIAKASLR